MYEFRLRFHWNMSLMFQLTVIQALVQIMASQRPGDKSLSEPMMVGLLTHMCITRPQWVTVVSHILYVHICIVPSPSGGQWSGQSLAGTIIMINQVNHSMNSPLLKKPRYVLTCSRNISPVKWIYTCLIRRSSDAINIIQFSQLSFMQYMGLCVFTLF